MFSTVSSFVVLVTIGGSSFGQREFSCTTADFCDDGIEIDPRIQTPAEKPSEDSCPSGYTSCFNVKCGIARVQPGPQDGIATQSAFPWHAFLQDTNAIANPKKGYIGGGVLIDQYFVLTAAHKVTNITSVNVIMGVYNTAELKADQTYHVESVYHHTKYNQTNLKNDIALLRLAKPVNIGNDVNVICLPESGTNYQGKTSGCIVSGYGQTSFTMYDAPTEFMKQVHVPITTTAKCKEAMSQPHVLSYKAAEYLDGDNELCAGGQTELDACTQDGGSPLVCLDDKTKTYQVAGLVIWGKKCGQPGVYGVYVNVPVYLDWIHCTMLCVQRKQTDCKDCPATKYL